ncbi:armadillo-type protein [Armillaria luteobubalina]|uniref:Armadillo-type protein n=1 Tax=Armillaria luteobubalina TaxID=153913 RepID=A0AA39Q3W8_9AGAR|nr:armadillo-type protein [Armillaria luteobubalina]
MHQVLGAYVSSKDWSTTILLTLSLCLLYYRSNVWIRVKKVIDKKWGGDAKRAAVLTADPQQGSNEAPTDPGAGPTELSAQPRLRRVVRLKRSAYRWDRRFFRSRNPNSPDVVDRKVRALLNKLTMKRFDSLSDQIIAWANKSEKDKDGRTLIQVIRLVFEKATDEAMWSEMYARLCRKMMAQISPKVQDDGIKNAEGKPITGGQLFRTYLLNRCQGDFERGWVAKEATTAVAASKAIEDQASNAAAQAKGDREESITINSEEYYAAQKAKRQGLGLIKFIGELFKLQMLTERIMHECVKQLLGNAEKPEEEEIESLCMLLTTVGGLLDTLKARAHMDVCFSRMKELTKNPNVSSRMQFMLQASFTSLDIIELRERKWVGHNAVAVPTTMAPVHDSEAAPEENATQEKESYRRQMSISCDGSWRSGERVNFGQIEGAFVIFGPQSRRCYVRKKDKREAV